MDGPIRPANRTRTSVQVFESGHAVTSRPDSVATEEPLETRVVTASGRQTVAVTMRTPGADFELAAGFLHGEGIVTTNKDVSRITYCVDPGVAVDQRYNIVNVELRAGVNLDLRGLERHFFTSSACGVCGKAGIDQLRIRCTSPLPSGQPVVSASTLRSLPGQLRARQRLFDATGGLHAAALFDADGHLQVLREDVGRHNAVDKVVGWGLLNSRLPFATSILLVSGRTSYEILQKAVAAGIPVVCAISAPSSLAIEVARAFGVTLVGFLRGERFNVYSSGERVSDG